jgi:S-ribosylhomocysteine lyase LuxS involved in autoinducer biosynthesis
MTLDEMINKLQEIKSVSPLGGETVVYLSLTNSELEPRIIHNVVGVPDDNGYIVEVRSTLPLAVTNQLGK